MDDQRGQAIARFCNAALEMTESRHAAYLNAACRDDEVLRREVESLLAAESAAASQVTLRRLREIGILCGCLMAAFRLRGSLTSSGDISKRVTARDKAANIALLRQAECGRDGGSAKGVLAPP